MAFVKYPVAKPNRTPVLVSSGVSPAPPGNVDAGRKRSFSVSSPVYGHFGYREEIKLSERWTT